MDEEKPGTSYIVVDVEDSNSTAVVSSDSNPMDNSSDTSSGKEHATRKRKRSATEETEIVDREEDGVAGKPAIESNQAGVTEGRDGTAPRTTEEGSKSKKKKSKKSKKERRRKTRSERERVDQESATDSNVFTVVEYSPDQPQSLNDTPVPTSQLHRPGYMGIPSRLQQSRFVIQLDTSSSDEENPGTNTVDPFLVEQESNQEPNEPTENTENNVIDVGTSSCLPPSSPAEE